MINENIIFQTVFGSRLYGTDTPESDTDIKGVYIPCGDDIILQRVKPVISHNTKSSDSVEKNTAEDIDQEYYSLAKFMLLASQGQTVALDCLFATRLLIDQGVDHLEGGGMGNKNGFFNHIWLDLYKNRRRLASKQCQSFIGYCRQQANKYGIKGSRVAAVRSIATQLGELNKTEPLKRLGELEWALTVMANNSEHINIVSIQIDPSGKMLNHLDVCNRKAPFTITVKDAFKMYSKLLADYGKRALEAEKNEGVDWKALSHAARIGHQSISYLEKGKMVFPSPNRKHLLAIKTGKIPYKDVALEIEQLLEGVEKAAANSTLPAEPDHEWMEQFLLKHYREVITNA